MKSECLPFLIIDMVALVLVLAQALLQNRVKPGIGTHLKMAEYNATCVRERVNYMKASKACVLCESANLMQSA